MYMYITKKRHTKLAQGWRWLLHGSRIWRCFPTSSGPIQPRMATSHTSWWGCSVRRIRRRTETPRTLRNSEKPVPCSRCAGKITFDWTITSLEDHATEDHATARSRAWRSRDDWKITWLIEDHVPGYQVTFRRSRDWQKITRLKITWLKITWLKITCLNITWQIRCV